MNITNKMDFEFVDIIKGLPDSIIKEEIIKNQANTIEKQAEAIKKLEENMKLLIKRTNEEEKTHQMFSFHIRKDLYQSILLQSN